MKIRIERKKTATVIVMYSLYLYFLGLSLLNESLHTSYDVVIGDLYVVIINFRVVMRGIINIHYYYILTCCTTNYS